MVDILAFDCGLAFALRDSSASLISGSAILDLVRLTLIPIVFLLIVARVCRQLSSSIRLKSLSYHFMALAQVGAPVCSLVSN